MSGRDLDEPTSVNFNPAAAGPFMVGETIPGYCCGNFPLGTMDDDLRVEAVGIDWVVLRGGSGGVLFYEGSHSELRYAAATTTRDRRDRETER